MNLLREIIWWLIFSVVLALFHLIFSSLVCILRKKPMPTQVWLRDGSLLFFATTLTSITFGQYFKNMFAHESQWLHLAAFIGMVAIILPSVGIYSINIGAHFTQRTRTYFDPSRFPYFCMVMAVSAVIYSLPISLIIENSQ